MTDGYIGPKQHGLAMGLLLFGGLLLVCTPNAVLGLRYQCVLHQLTGLRCPFCGMTRDFILMAHGSWPQNNPGSLVLALALYCAYPVWLAMSARRGPSRMLVQRDRVIRALVVVMVLLFIGNNLVS